jgi:CRP-like cAMP-binding protein
MGRSEIIPYLAGIDLFSEVDPDSLDQILSDAATICYQAGDTLFYQEDPADNFYILVEGRIKLSQLTPEGDQVAMHYLKPGEAFGIIAVLREINFPVTAEAVDACRCIVWSADRMTRWIQIYPQVAINSIRILSRFILDFQDRIRELSTERVERRIARAILRLATHGGEKVADGISLGFKLTRQDIAELSGTTLFTVSRTLSKWESQGLVDCRQSAILLKEFHALTEIAEDL